MALPAGVTLNWIWPFIPLTSANEYNTEGFEELMYRPLYMFGNNGNSVAVNYPLSLADAAGVLRRRQDRDDHHEGLEVDQRRDR